MKLIYLTLCVAMLCVSASSFAAPLTTYTQVNVNSATSVNDPAPDLVRNNSGATASVAAVGSTTNRAFSNGSGGYTVKSVTDSVSGVASLEDATLKAYASGGFGSNGMVSGAPLPSQIRGVASSTVEFADSFRTFANNQPFLWSDGDSVSFSFGVTGSTSVPSGLDGNNSQVLSSLSFNVYTAGTLDIIDQLRNFDFGGDYSPENIARWQALADEVNARLIDRGFWYLGEAQTAPFPIEPEMIIALDVDTPSMIDFDFTPGGDFDWVLMLDVGFQLDQALENTSVTLDFAHSATAAYQGVAGTTTYSASGFFPDTLSLDDAPTNNPIPVPATLPLVALGLLGISLRRRQG